MLTDVKAALTTQEHPLILIATVDGKNIDNQDPVEFLKTSLQNALGTTISFGEHTINNDCNLINIAFNGNNLPTLQAVVNRYGEPIARDVWSYIEQSSGLSVMGWGAIRAIYGEQPFNELDSVIRSAYFHALFQGLNHTNFGFVE